MKIVALGDSITEGFPYNKQKSWVNYVAQELKLEIINKGICGDLTSNMLERFSQDVLTFAPTHVIILGGTNDAFMGYSLTKVNSNFVAMVEASRLNGIIPILGLPVPILLAEEGILREYRNWLKEYANRESIRIIDFYSPFMTEVENGEVYKLFVDEVHPSIEGYKLMGLTAVESLKEIGVSK